MNLQEIRKRPARQGNEAQTLFDNRPSIGEPKDREVSAHLKLLGLAARSAPTFG
jgi:hypothetical protein